MPISLIHLVTTDMAVQTVASMKKSASVGTNNLWVGVQVPHFYISEQNLKESLSVCFR